MAIARTLRSMIGQLEALDKNAKHLYRKVDNESEWHRTGQYVKNLRLGVNIEQMCDPAIEGILDQLSDVTFFTSKTKEYVERLLSNIFIIDEIKQMS